MKITSKIKSETSIEDEWTFPMLLISNNNEQIILVDKVAGGTSKYFYQGLVLYGKEKVAMSWWTELTSLPWIKENYKPFYGEITISSLPNT